jgi:hypothetical protein
VVVRTLQVLLVHQELCLQLGQAAAVLAQPEQVVLVEALVQQVLEVRRQVREQVVLLALLAQR